MARLAGYGGVAYTDILLLENCEDAWVNGTNGAASLEATIVKVGSGSAKCIMTSVSNNDVVMYEALASATNLSTYHHILCWARCAANAAAADFRLCFDKDAGAPASPESLVDLPALVINTWKFCHCTEVSGNTLDDSTAAVTIGLEMNANAQDTTIYLDHIMAAKATVGIKSWTLDQVYDVHESTAFDSSGVKAYIPGSYGWSGTFEGFKTGAPLTIGSLLAIELGESSTSTQMWRGVGVITGLHPSTSIDGLVSYSYDFQGSDGLVIPTT